MKSQKQSTMCHHENRTRARDAQAAIPEKCSGPTKCCEGVAGGSSLTTALHHDPRLGIRAAFCHHGHGIGYVTGSTAYHNAKKSRVMHTRSFRFDTRAGKCRPTQNGTIPRDAYACLQGGMEAKESSSLLGGAH